MARNVRLNDEPAAELQRLYLVPEVADESEEEADKCQGGNPFRYCTGYVRCKSSVRGFPVKFILGVALDP